MTSPGTRIVAATSTVVIPEYLNEAASSIITKSQELLDAIKRIPGGKIIIDYIRASYQNDPYRSLFEFILVAFAIRYFLKSKSSYSKKDYIKLTEKEIDELVADWQPAPLTVPLRDDEKWQLDSIPITKGQISSHTEIIDNRDNGKLKSVINLASLNFLDLGINKEMIEAGIEQINYSGVGACGPPNFYGTQDVHFRLEEDLARFFGAEKSILYAQDFCTAQSIIPCFLKRGDIAIVDGGVSLQLQKAVMISRCEVFWYDHNDLESLEKTLKFVNEDFRGEPLTRRFIITEGLFENYGDSPDLKALVDLKKKYKYRLIIEESRSLGVLGATGRGLAEVYNIPRSDIDITVGSMALAFASSGGFCIGETPMINYQKLQSNAYVYSAALPPYCAKVCSKALSLIENATSENGNSNKIIGRLHLKIKKFYKLLSSDKKLNECVTIVSEPESPTIHLRISKSIREKLELPASYGGIGSNMEKFVEKGLEENYFDEEYNLENYLLQIIIDKILKSNILITRSKRILHHELLPLIPELIINVNAGITEDEIVRCHQVISKEIIDTLTNINLKTFDNLI
ncbi:hypothetical protein PACTADRAFT_185043 [Pachysolen tannophilus NRRL Y-2460]|uniref:serine C-palmitoyltransferase n=1 Tax=Pachysolen tannophilus NRRL Y-2460 TaxID=669874 RepID=A0A1E4U343_PACTA|nr:hypothetical protein PACTADRAFT_185043 [Pachysolen tannophilus NRRL Y-2460]